MKWEQKVKVETVEYICWVKRIDGVVAQKQLVSELIRCKDCKYNPYTQNLEASVAEVVHGTTGQCWSFATNPQRYCSMAERKES